MYIMLWNFYTNIYNFYEEKIKFFTFHEDKALMDLTDNSASSQYEIIVRYISVRNYCGIEG